MQKSLNHYMKFPKGSVIKDSNIYYIIIKNIYFDDEEIECLPLKININKKEATILKERIILKNKNYDILPIHIHEAKLNLTIEKIRANENCKPYLKQLSLLGNK